MDPLQQLSSPELRALAAAIGSGRQSPPFTGMNLARSVSPAVSEAVASRLNELIHLGMTALHLRILLESIHQAQSPRGEAAVQLVWTGPDAGEVEPRDTAVVVRELFSQARESVLVAGFAVYRGRAVFRLLAERMMEIPNLEVCLFLDVRRQSQEPTTTSKILTRFRKKFIEADWPEGCPVPCVYYDPRSLETDPAKRASLHAKCVVVDRRLAFVSSANFTEAAQERNIEAGVLVNDERFASRLVDQFESLIETKHLNQLHFRFQN